VDRPVIDRPPPVVCTMPPADRRSGASNQDRCPMSMESAESQGGVAAGELRQFIERIERLEEEKKALQDDIKDVMAELKGRGY